MDTLDSLLAAIPDDPRTAFVVADFLEEQGDPHGELIRLTYTLTRQARLPGRAALEERLRELLYTQKLLPPVPLREVKLGSERVAMAWIPPGSFRMGSPVRERNREDEENLHVVTLTRGFWMGIYPVTQAQWNALRKRNPSEFISDDFPVDNISWQMAAEFCTRAAKLSRVPFRLPTEAEWEYACRAGTTTAYHFGKTLSPNQALYETDLSEDTGTQEVGLFPPNAFGLYDMHGNVFEWVQDAWEEGYYASSPAVDPTGPDAKESYGRILRGGSWAYDVGSARSAFRIHAGRDYGYYDQGFRLVCDHIPAPTRVKKKRP